MNKNRKFDNVQAESLGKYVYLLIDPRDNFVLYVGQGIGNRVFSHFNEAEEALKDGTPRSKKVDRIIDIWNDDLDVEYVIAASSLDADSGVADIVESSIYSSLSTSSNGVPLNEVNPPSSSFLNSQDLENLKAVPVNPPIPYSAVFIFNVKKGLEQRDSFYNATRMAWKVTEEYRNMDAYAVGLRDGISIGAFKIAKWQKASIVADKFEFISPNHPHPQPVEDLRIKNYKNILNGIGFWQRGNHLVVEFDGNSNFRYLRGGGARKDWMPCE